jgi:hypothetical protein
MVKEGSWYNPSMDCCTSDMPSTGGVSSAELPVSLWHQELYREQIDGSSDSSGTWSQRGGYMDRAADREEEIEVPRAGEHIRCGSVECRRLG